MTENGAIRAALFTVPFSQDFCDATVSAVFETCGTDPLAINQLLLLLPNNRAIKAMTEAFVRRAAPGLLLPKMAAVGDLALDEALGPIIDPLTGDSDLVILPTIDPLERLTILTNLIVSQKQKMGSTISATQAVHMARQLAATLDELNVERIGHSEFPTLDTASDLAKHWQSAYGDLLHIWPQYLKILAERGLQDATNRRNQLLERLADNIGKPLQIGPIIAAGIATAAPAIAHLLRVIALRPDSKVILPSVDLQMPDASWDQLRPELIEEQDALFNANKEGHPQFHLKLLLDRMGFQRSEVVALNAKTGSAVLPISDIFCLSKETAGWLALPTARKKMKHLRVLVADDSAEEALAIAMLVREALNEKQRRIAIVTPDRELALRISTQLKRWDINADDSAGVALLQTANGALFKALAYWIAERFTPSRLLAILQHPLVHAGDGRLAHLEKVRALDLLVRGPMMGAGLFAITQRVEDALAKARGPSLVRLTELQSWWGQYSELLAPLEAMAEKGLSVLLPNIIETLDGLSDGIIWQGANGRQLAAFLEAIESSDIGAVTGQQAEALPHFIDSLFEGQVVRPAYGGHPRVAIYGLLEARLQQADLIICAGLYEGSWPQTTQPDPWLAPHIRRRLSLSGMDRNIGLAAHDLATFMGATEVILTRAKRDRSGPMVASRFLLRLQAFLGDNLQTELVALDRAKAIDIGASVPAATPPKPRPSAQQRKIDLSVTDFDKLKADPYAIYARKILNLEPLDELDAEPDAAWQGTVIHDLLEEWADKYDWDEAQLIPLAERYFNNPAFHPTLSAMWQPKIMAGLKWVAAETERMKREQDRKPILAEAVGNIILQGVTVKGRADRVDKMADGSMAVIDYKTGGTPSDKQIFNGFALQLGLMGLMLHEGGFDKVTAESRAFEYWAVAKRAKGSEFGAIKKASVETPKKNKILTHEFVDFSREHAVAALENWINGDAPFTAKLHPEYPHYKDFDQLNRLAEWDGRQPVDDEAADNE
jgi:ATP-dependent helicase/nuclease subunit B